MKRFVLKRFHLILITVIFLCLCSCTRKISETGENFQESLEITSPELESPFEVEVNTETFQLSFKVNGQTIPISDGFGTYITILTNRFGLNLSWNRIT